MLHDDLEEALDPVEFAQGLGFAPDPWQARLLRWGGKRLLLNCSRQSGKSTVTSVVVAHRSIYFPQSLTIMVSPSLRQSQELFRKFCGWIELAGVALVESTNISCELNNGSRVLSLPSSEETIRGFSGAALVIEDEASRCPDALYLAVRPMLATSGGRLILMSTPWGKRGHFFEEWTEGGPTWERFEVPATACPRISPEFLAEEKRTMPERWYRQEYGCEFCEVEDSLFSFDDVSEAVTDTVPALEI